MNPKPSTHQTTALETRYAPDPVRFERMTTDEMREALLVDLFAPDQVKLVYSHVDRAIVGSAVPASGPLHLEADRKSMAAETFCERRELGVFNMGAKGNVVVDGETFTLEHCDALYVGRGAKEITFQAAGAEPPRYYLVSYPAHASHPTRQARPGEAEVLALGDADQCNERVLHKYFHPGGIQSCQLTMGFTVLKPGSVWNTMPCHTHTRRSEVYMYFGLGEDDVVIHLHGRPDATSHLVVRNGQAVISPSWSIHCGCGTSNYSFVWAMGGENQQFDDMDGVPMRDLR